jgi:putative nucleotidyltransferase with HDIG domain
LIYPTSLRPVAYPLEVGDVAPQDIQAPRALTYQSEVLTNQSRADAANLVVPVYLPPDASIARRQIERLRVTLNYISIVRLDGYATRDQKLDDLSRLNNLQFQPGAAQLTLSLSDARWQEVQAESVNVLEQVMRNTIRDDRLDDTLRSIPSLISFSLTQDQATLVTGLVSAFIVPNSLYSAQQTEAARSAARNSISPISRSFIQGETVVQRGQVVTPTIREALVQFGLIEPKNNELQYIAAGALVALIGCFLGLYFYRRRPAVLEDMRSLVVIAFTFLIFLLGARYIIPNRTVLPYIYPIAAFGLTIAALYNLEIGMILSLILGILSAYGLQNSLDLTLFYVLGSFCGILILSKARHIANFLWAGLAVGAAGIAVILAYRLPDTVIDWLGLATLACAALLNGLASASVAILVEFLFSQILGLTTALQLLELSRPDHPLLQFILRNAPGTYQHSLQVANLAEQAAEEIGADGLLTRVGALYHDAGKALNPLFFIENQVPGKLNPHDDLDPSISAATIIRHVQDGLLLANRYRLPPRIRDFICEHHGTLITHYQYTRALQAAGQDPDRVDVSLFRYPGPRPQSRETALLMLADGCEARARAELPKDDRELYKLIQAVFERCQKEGQLDDTRITLRDLSRAADSFASTLRGIYHPRIPYPELNTAPSISEIPTQPVGLDASVQPEELQAANPIQSTPLIPPQP